MSETKTYEGQLRLDEHDEGTDILFLSSLEEPLAEVLQDEISGCTVTARYWITDEQIDKETAQEQFTKHLMGFADCDFGHRYSEITGYLWTDEDIKIGGHDLLGELRFHVGKWLILEVEVH